MSKVRKQNCVKQNERKTNIGKAKQKDYATDNKIRITNDGIKVVQEHTIKLSELEKGGLTNTKIPPTIL